MKTLKFLLSSLFSNDTIIDEEKKQPLYLAIILLIVSVVLTAVPTFVSYMTVNGDDVITADANYDVDYSLEQFAYEYLSDGAEADKKITATIKDKKLTVENFDNPVRVYYGEETSMIAAYSTDADFNTTLHTLCTDEQYTVSNNHSLLIFTESNVYLYLFAKDTTITMEQNSDGTWKFSETPYKGYTYGNYKKVSFGSLNSIYPSSTKDAENYNKALENWETFFREAYQPVKVSLAWANAGVYSGINLAIVLLMGLMLFLMSRSKKAYRKYSFVEALKIVSYAALSPAIIALALGFAISSMQSIAFVLTFGLRATWLSMKATNPPADAQSTPVRK